MSCDVPPYLHRELARTGAVPRLRAAAEIVANPIGYLRAPELADGLRDTAILIEKQIAEPTQDASRPGITEAEIENAVRDAMNSLPMGTFGQIIDHAVRKLALDNVRLRSELAAAVGSADTTLAFREQRLRQEAERELAALRVKLEAAACQRCADSVDRVDAEQRAIALRALLAELHDKLDGQGWYVGQEQLEQRVEKALGG